MPLAGAPASLTVKGTGHLRSLQEMTAQVTAQRTGGNGDYALQLQFDPARMDATLKVQEPANGPLENLIKVPVMHGTIPHDQLAKEGAAKVLIKPAAHGTGVIAGGSMRAVLESAGVTDVLAKSLGSANPHNVFKATFKALAMLREPIQVSRTRHISLKKVFNG